MVQLLFKIGAFYLPVDHCCDFFFFSLLGWLTSAMVLNSWVFALDADLFSFLQWSFLLSFFQVFENATVGSSVGQCRVDDEDKGQSYVYSLLNDDNGLFTITSSGQVKIAKKVDFETQTAHKITVFVKNSNQNVRGEFPFKFLACVRMCCLLICPSFTWLPWTWKCFQSCKKLGCW